MGVRSGMDEDLLLKQVELVKHWTDKAQTDEDWEFVKALSNIVGRNMREHLDTLPPDERDFCLRLLGTKEQWAAGVADGIETAREAGDLRAVRMGEELLQEAFALNTITRH